MKIFTYHSGQYKKETGILRRDIQNEANWTKYGGDLQMAASHNNRQAFQGALNTARNIFERHLRKENESLLKGQCRNIMAQVYQGLDMYEDASKFIQENLDLHQKSGKIYNLLMRDALHCKRFNEIRSAGIRAEEIIDTLNPQYQEIL
jgi:hypothetical protein